MQAAVPQDVRRARLLRGDELTRQAQLRAQIHRGRFLKKERIGAAIDHPVAQALGLHNAAGRGGLIQHAKRRRMRTQVVGSGQAGDAGADDHDIDRLVHYAS